MKLLAQALAAGAVALMVLYPRTTEAEDVEDFERQGEWDDDGQRFGAIIIHGRLEASPTAPGGWTLVRTYENKSDDVAETTIEERVESTESLEGARVSPAPVTVLTRTQRLKLGPHEKKSIGVFLPATIGPKITEGQKRKALSRVLLGAGQYENLPMYDDYSVTYLRPLAPGETVAKHEWNGVLHPARMPAGPLPDLADDADEVAVAPATPAPKAKVAVTKRARKGDRW